MGLNDKINYIIDKYGSDKVMHFFLSGWITSMLSIFGFKGLFLGFVFVTLISYIKEKYIDIVFDKNDILAGILGSITSIVMYTIFVFL